MQQSDAPPPAQAAAQPVATPNTRPPTNASDPLNMSIAATNWNCNALTPFVALNVAVLKGAAVDVIVAAEPGNWSSYPATRKLLRADFRLFMAPRPNQPAAQQHRGGVAVLVRHGRFDSDYRAAVGITGDTQVAIVDLYRPTTGGAPRGPTVRPCATVVGVYAQPQENHATSVADVRTAYMQAREKSDNVFVVGDLNARHFAWGDTTVSTRGAKLHDFAQEQRLQVLGGPTFDNSCLDIVMAPGRLHCIEPTLFNMSKWDHRALVTRCDPAPEAPASVSVRTRIPKELTADQEARFLATLDEGLTGLSGTPHGQEQRIFRALRDAMATLPGGIPRRRKARYKPPDVLEVLQAARTSAWKARRTLRREVTTLPPVMTGMSGEKVKRAELPAAMLALYGSRGKQRSHGNPRPQPIVPSHVTAVTREEVREACHAHRPDGGQDSDGITPRVMNLAARSDKFCDAMAHLVTSCMQKGKVPLRWRQAVIVPILKRMKDVLALDSYRPVMLASLLARTGDRVIDARIKHVWTPHEAQDGFRKGVPSVTIPMAIISAARKAAERNYNYPGDRVTKGRTMVIAVDASDAFPGASVQSILDGYDGLPEDLMAFKVAMLSERQVRVRISADEKSKWDDIEDGTNQGYVSGPTDYSAASKSQLRVVEEWAKRRGTTKNGYGMVADDLTVWISGNPTEVIASAKSFLARLYNWATENKVKISSKTCALWVAPETATNDAAACPEKELHCGDLPVPIKSGGDTIKILGWILDGRMTLRGMVDDICARHDQALMEMMPVVLHTRSAQRKEMYEALAVSHIRRSAPLLLAAFGSNDGAWTKLDSHLATGSRHITGAHASAHSAAARHEAGFYSSRSMALRESATLLAKLRGSGRQDDITKTCIAWLEQTTKAQNMTVAGDVDSTLVDRQAAAPWQLRFKDQVSFVSQPPLSREEREAVEAEDDVSGPALKKLANERVRASLDRTAFVIFTDGSVRKSDARHPKAGGAGAAILFYPYEQLETAAKRAPAGAFACSYSAELRGIECALDIIASGLVPAGAKIIVLSDSQGVVAALEKGLMKQTDARTSRIWKRMLDLAEHKAIRIEFRFIYGHTDWAQADRADDEAKREATRGGETSGGQWWKDIARAAAKTPVNKVEREALVGSVKGRCRQFTPCKWPKKVFGRWPEADRTLMAQVRTNACAKIGGHLHNQLGTCSKCGVITYRGAAPHVGMPSMTEHLFICRRMRVARSTLRLRGVYSLWTKPEAALSYIRAFVT